MAGSRALVALVIALFVASAASAGSANPAKADGAVTCGSVITLKGSRVGSTVACQEVAYGGQGSGQMACTGHGCPTQTVTSRSAVWRERSVCRGSRSPRERRLGCRIR